MDKRGGHDEVAGYRLLRHLGSGNLGVVYRAMKRGASREVALRVLMMTPSQIVSGLGDYFRTAFATRIAMSHPSFPDILECGVSRGTIWIAASLVPGWSVRDALQQSGPFGHATATQIIIETMRALDAAVQQELGHFALHPTRIMLLSADGRLQPRVLGLGVREAMEEAVARCPKDTSVPSSMIGSPRYMAPEQVANEPIGGHTDVYAGALILSEMITGFPAVPGHSLHEILLRQMSASVAIPEVLQGTPLGAVLKRALVKDIQERYATPAAFANALEEALPTT